jgi:hypothetical protein
MQDDSRVRPPSRPAQLAQLLFVSLSLMEEVCRRADTAEPMRAEKTSTRYSEVTVWFPYQPHDGRAQDPATEQLLYSCGLSMHVRRWSQVWRWQAPVGFAANLVLAELTGTT